MISVPEKPTIEFTLDELHTIYKLLERQYIGYENVEAVKLIRQIQKILYNHGLIK